MARPLRIQFPGAFYHITCRGLERRNIYLDDKDRGMFLSLLSRSLETYQVVLHTYIMMNNHFHLLIQTMKANCSEFMRHFNICYTGWFNRRYGRVGNLYQGRYKAFLVDVDNYLLEVSRYLHLNSVRVRGLQSLDYRACWRYARGYRWSSLAGYVSEQGVEDFVNYNLILTVVGGRAQYRAFILDGLRRGIVSPFKDVFGNMILGGKEFISKVKGFLRRGSRREQPAYRDLVSNILLPEVVLQILAKEFGIRVELVCRRGGEGIVRGMVAELLYRFSDVTQAEIGRLLGGIDYMAVYQLRRRFRAKLIQDAGLRKRYAEAENVLKESLL